MSESYINGIVQSDFLVRFLLHIIIHVFHCYIFEISLQAWLMNEYQTVIHFHGWIVFPYIKY